MKTLKLLAAMLLAVVFAAPAFSQQYWSDGPYVGINAGLGQGKYVEVPDYARDQIKVNGGLFGVQWGYNLKFGSLVVGMETDLQKGGGDGNRSTNLCPGCTNYTDVVKDAARLDWFGTTRVRIGYPVGRFLPYVTGGIAYGSIGQSSREDIAATGKYKFSYSYSSSETQTAVGSVYGAGLEYALTDNWRVRGEYMRVNLGIIKSQNNYSSREVDLESNIFRFAANRSF